MMLSKLRLCSVLAVVMLSNACTTVNVDHVQLVDTINVKAGDNMVVLGRHNSAEFETEPSLVSCVGQRLQRAIPNISVIPEAEFVNQFYPYFEARTAPLKPERLKQILAEPLVAERLTHLGLKYFIWVEGSTEQTGASGSLACSITGAGGGCFGIGIWEDTSDYEAIVWDVQAFSEVARVSTEAVGTSYMPAFVVPVPFIARVQSNACQGMGEQLSKFFNGESTALKVIDK